MIYSLAFLHSSASKKETDAIAPLLRVVARSVILDGEIRPILGNAFDRVCYIVEDVYYARLR
jgi:hypothetical protein